MNSIKHFLPKLPRFLLAIPMILAGFAKLAGVPELHQSFSMMGLPVWFGYFIGAAELAAGIGLFIPRVSVAAAVGLMPIMLGAAYFHIVYAVPSAIPAFMLFMLSIFVIYIQKKHNWSTSVANVN